MKPEGHPLIKQQAVAALHTLLAQVEAGTVAVVEAQVKEEARGLALLVVWQDLEPEAPEPPPVPLTVKSPCPSCGGPLADLVGELGCGSCGATYADPAA